MRKLIKKYQTAWAPLPKLLTSSNPFGQTGLNSKSTMNTGMYGMSKLNLDAFTKPMGNFDPKSGLVVQKFDTFKQPKMDTSLLGGDISKVASGSTDIGKAANAAKLTKGLNVANQLADPILQVGEGIAKSLGAEFAGKDAQSGLTDTVAAGLSLIPGVGSIASMGLKLFDTLDRGLGKKVKSFNGNTGVASYSDFSTQGNAYRATAGNKAKRAETDKLQNQQFYARGMENVNQQKKKSDAALNTTNQYQIRNQYASMGGFNPNALMGKNGTKLRFTNIKNSVNHKFKSKLVLPIEEVEVKEIDLFEEGGKFNVIPDGALHARKHNLSDELKKDITDKGIPVIEVAEKGDVLEYENDKKTPKILAEGGEIIQHAEIEVNEIIFNKELTDKLEKMFKEFKNGDESVAIKAGKLLTYEILENTQDNTGLTETINV